MGALANAVKGKTGAKIQRNNTTTKITSKNLQILLIKGPIGGRPEMSVSFSGGIAQVADADENFEEFMGILNSLGTGGDAIKDEGGRRTLTLAGKVIGLPVENPFTGGIRGYGFERRFGAGGQ
jgi:hypothetical protein